MKTAARRDRLLSLLHRGSTTVPTLARALGVVDRTIYRDISALREAGHDVRAMPGPGGGVRIAPDSRPRPVHFEVHEIIGLALCVAIQRASPHSPFVSGAEAALDRARRALSSDRQRAIQRLERRILIGVPATERVRQSCGPIGDRVLTVFEHCFTHARAMAFEYVDGTGASSTRRIECVGLLHHAPVWYILAWDLDKDAARLFRMDRIAAATRARALEGRHPLTQVMAVAAPGATAVDAWGRRPLG